MISEYKSEFLQCFCYISCIYGHFDVKNVLNLVLQLRIMWLRYHCDIDMIREYYDF